MILQTNWSSGQQPKEGQIGEEKESPMVSCTVEDTGEEGVFKSGKPSYKIVKTEKKG